MTNDLLPWLKDIIDRDASPSFGRASSFIIIYFLILWSCWLISLNGKMIDIPNGWLILIGILWGGDAGKEAATNIANKFKGETNG